MKNNFHNYNYSIQLILHPSKQLLDSYFGHDSKRYKFHYDKLSEPEISTLFTLLTILPANKIIRLPVVNYPEHIKMPDFLFNNTEVEVKTPKTKRGLEDRIRASKTQFRKEGILAIDLDYYKDNLFNITKVLEHYLGLHEIKNALAILHNKVIYRKPTKKWLPAAYAGDDRH